MTHFWRRLAVAQARRPGSILLLFALLGALGLWRAARLRLVTDFGDMLPPDQPSVVELHRMTKRARGLSTVLVVLEGPDERALREVADTLVPHLLALGGPTVESARSGVQEARRFLMPRAGLYLSEAELADIEQQVADRERAAYKRAIGADLDDDEARDERGGDGARKRDANPDALDAAALERRFLGKLGPVARLPGGYYLARTATGAAQVIAIRSAVTTGDLAGAHRTLDLVSGVVSRTLAQRREWAPIRAGYAGDLLTSTAEYDLIRRDVLDVGLLGVALVFGVVILFFRNVHVLLAIGTAMLIGCALTFGVTELVIGHLNVATAFLFSIVAGNGINFGIIWVARFLEERRAGRGTAHAIELALRTTAGPTITAACAAATAYAALGIGRFRGFQHFAFIGGSGMLLCWIVNYACMPPVMVLWERWLRRARTWLGRRDARATGAPHPHTRSPRFTHYEAPFLWLVQRAPRTTLCVLLALFVVSASAGGRYLRRGALEYDMRHLQSDRDTTGELYRVSHLAGRVMGDDGQASMVVLTDDARDTPLLASALRAIRDRAPANARPFEDVHTLDDFVPPHQAERLTRLRKLAARLMRDHDRGAIDEATWAKLEPLLPPDGLAPFGVDALPAQLVEPFTEKDGTRGRVLYIDQTNGESDSDLHYLLRWADAFRSTRLPNGHVVHGSGRAVIFADLLRASLVDMPRAVMLSLSLTALMVAFLFRRPRAIAMVLGSLLMALAWMLAAMSVLRVRFSFISFIALPITFGIGIDYAVNIYGRYQQDPAGDIVAALRGTGGAVILCSLTTSLGYLALLRAHNQAVRNLGAIAVLGEVSCLSAALLALPAAVIWLGRRKRARD